MERGNAASPRGKTRTGIERLSDKTIASWIKAGGNAGQKLADGKGLYLTRLPSGSASWQIRYQIGDKQGTFSLGVYPEVPLAEAREHRKRIKDQAKQGVDPVLVRSAKRLEKVEANEHTFAELTTEWLQHDKRADWAESHRVRSKRALDRDVLPTLGRYPVADITPAMVTRVIEKIQSRGVFDTTQKIHQHVRDIFTYGMALGLVKSRENPAQPAEAIIKSAPDAGHHPALLTFPELGDLLRRAETCNTTAAVRLCHTLIAHTVVRISNAIEARWEDFHLDAKPALWVVPREQMKIRGKGRTHPHKVVLTDQIVAELKRWQEASGVRKGFVFPGNAEREFISRDSVSKMLRETLALADKHSPHGWRSSFSTLAREETDFDPELIDLALDHIHNSKTAMAYDRGTRLTKRIELMKWWGDSLQKAMRGAEVVQFKRSRA
jgi:integrase